MAGESGYSMQPSVVQGDVASSLTELAALARSGEEPLTQVLAPVTDSSFGHLSEARTAREAFMEAVAGAVGDLRKLDADGTLLASKVKDAASSCSNADDGAAGTFAALGIPSAWTSTGTIPLDGTLLVGPQAQPAQGVPPIGGGAR